METVCEVCDGFGHCVSCEGSGLLRNENVCPSCEGDGLCSRCRGAGYQDEIEDEDYVDGCEDVYDH